MKHFFSQAQIISWYTSVWPAGPVSVLKRVEHGTDLVITCLPSGRMKAGLLLQAR